MVTACRPRAVRATTCIFQPRITRRHVCPARKEPSPLRKAPLCVLLAALDSSLQSIGLRRRKRVKCALLAPIVCLDPSCRSRAHWVNTVSLDPPDVRCVLKVIFRLFWAQHHPAAAKLAHWALMRPPPAFQVVQDAHMVSSAIKLRQPCAKNAP